MSAFHSFPANYLPYYSVTVVVCAIIIQQAIFATFVGFVGTDIAILGIGPGMCFCSGYFIISAKICKAIFWKVVGVILRRGGVVIVFLCDCFSVWRDTVHSISSVVFYIVCVVICIICVV